MYIVIIFCMGIMFVCLSFMSLREFVEMRIKRGRIKVTQCEWGKELEPTERDQQELKSRV